MIVAIGVMFVTGLLTIAAFTAANGDIHLSHESSSQKQAYYAALAGIQQYEYQMQVNPDYWETCKTPNGTVSEGSSERYEIKPLVASTAPASIKECSTSKPFESMIQSNGAAANTFRIESTGYAGNNTRSLVGTFQVSGFLNYVYYTNYETEDPGLYPQEKSAPSGCAKKFYAERPSGCTSIQFTTGDAVNGPMHTNDAADVCGGATFGRPGQSPADKVEINGGTYGSGCSGTPTYYTGTGGTSGEYTKGKELIPPQSDSTLGAYVEKEYEFTGVTHITLNGTVMTVENKKETKVLSWPKNGLVFVRRNKSQACGYEYHAEGADSSTEVSEEANCGTVYVSGKYTESLTIGAENNLVINGSIYPSSVENKIGSAPSGTVALGLIANEYVRIYHPITEEECETKFGHYNCSGGGENAEGSLKSPWIYAAILSTQHSFVVDNNGSGEPLGNLNVYGAIAQDYRGIVGTGTSTKISTGYLKNYIYDERLAVDEPPYFLSPLNAGWKVARETAPKAG
jgi:Tfp pilus assembly protein PilX